MSNIFKENKTEHYNIKIVTRGNEQGHHNNFAMYQMNSKKQHTKQAKAKANGNFLLNQTKWLGKERDENRINLNGNTVEAKLKLKSPGNTKGDKSFR